MSKVGVAMAAILAVPMTRSPAAIDVPISIASPVVFDSNVTVAPPPEATTLPAMPSASAFKSILPPVFAVSRFPVTATEMPPAFVSTSAISPASFVTVPVTLSAAASVRPTLPVVVFVKVPRLAI